MAECFKVTFEYTHEVVFYVSADTKQDVHDFIEDNPAWQPGDVEGLIDVVGEDEESGYTVVGEDTISAGFTITPDLELVES